MPSRKDIIMIGQRRRLGFDLLEARALLSHGDFGSQSDLHLESKGLSPKLVGSIQGMETGFVNVGGFQLNGTGIVQPLGNVTATGLLMFNARTGAVNSHGTLTLANSQGSLTLSMSSTKGYLPLRSSSSEEIPVNVQVQSATGSFNGIRVKGTVNLVNEIIPHYMGTPGIDPLSVQFNLKPTK